jgi:hypothetical protein
MLKREIAETKRELPGIWDEFVDSDPRVLIDKLIELKLKKYPDDERLVVGVQFAPAPRYEEGGRIRVAYVTKEQREAFGKLPAAKQQAMINEMLDR